MSEAVEVKPDAEKAQMAEKIASLEATVRILSNTLGLLGDGLFVGAQADYVGESRRYLEALRNQAGSHLQALRGVPKIEAAKAKRERKAKKGSK